MAVPGVSILVLLDEFLEAGHRVSSHQIPGPVSILVLLDEFLEDEPDRLIKERLDLGFNPCSLG